MLARTMHAISYDEVNDEFVVPQAFSQAILTFRGGANGEEAPIRVIQGSLTQLQHPDRMDVDPVHNEIFVIERGFILVFPREANGNVAPIRRLEGPDTGITGFSRVAVDPIHNVMIVAGGGAFRIFNRTANGNVKPLRIITGGPISGTSGPRGLLAVYPPTGMFVATTSKYGSDIGEYGSRSRPRVSLDSFVGAWSIEDNGDVAPRWTIVHDILRQVRGVALDPKHKTLMVSDKYLNAIMTYHFPEIF